MKENHSDSYDHVLKYTGLFGGVQGLVTLIGLVRNKAMALLLGTGGMGLNALLLSFQNFASQATSLGIAFGAVPKLSEYYEEGRLEKVDHYIRVIRLWSVVAGILGFVFCVLVSPLVDALSFNWGNHTLHYAMLAVAVALMAITGGETAILKATRRLGTLARIQVFTAIGSVLASVPLYYFFYHSGVVPAIVLTTLLGMLTTIGYSLKCYPLHISFSREYFREGAGMLRLGLAFVLAAAVGSASEMAIRAYLNVVGGLEDVGLYNVGYMLTITYAGMVFSSLDNDYFPRLSAVSKDVAKSNETVNKQTEVSLLLLSPMLVALLMMLPVLVPLLFSGDFMPVVGMAQVAVLAMYFKVMSMPIAYITLARSRSLSYLFLETSYFVVLLLGVVAGYGMWGLWGTGVAIVVAHAAEFVLVSSYAYFNYDYRMTKAIVCYLAVQLAVGVVAYIVSVLADGWEYWTAEAALTMVSTAYSVYVLRQKTHLWEALKRRLHL